MALVNCKCPIVPGGTLLHAPDCPNHRLWVKQNWSRLYLGAGVAAVKSAQPGPKPATGHYLLDSVIFPYNGTTPLMHVINSWGGKSFSAISWGGKSFSAIPAISMCAVWHPMLANRPCEREIGHAGPHAIDGFAPPTHPAVCGYGPNAPRPGSPPFIPALHSLWRFGSDFVQRCNCYFGTRYYTDLRDEDHLFNYHGQQWPLFSLCCERVFCRGKGDLSRHGTGGMGHLCSTKHEFSSVSGGARYTVQCGSVWYRR